MNIKDILSGLLGKKILFNILLNESLCVFNYHDVTYTPSLFSRSFGLNVYPDLFEAQLKMIMNLFYIVKPDELLAKNYPCPAALITFDDGFSSYFKYAVPILTKLKIPSVIFLNMAPVEGDIFWGGLVTYLNYHDGNFKDYLIEKKFNKHIINKEYLYYDKNIIMEYLQTCLDNKKLFEKVRNYYGEFATEKDLKFHSTNPYIRFGNHLYNHYNVKTLSNSDLEHLYKKNQEKINKYSNSIEMFSFPFGQPESCYLLKHIESIKRMGSKAIFSAYPVPNYGQNSYFYHRFGMTSYVTSKSKLIFFLIYALVRNFIKQNVPGG